MRKIDSASCPSQDGFLHKGRIVYALQYRLVGGASIIVWLDRAGNDANGKLTHSDPARAIDTTRAGDVICYGGERFTVERGEAWSASARQE